MLRVTLLISLFVINTVELIIYPFKWLIAIGDALSITFIIFACVFTLRGFFKKNSIILCDSFLFGITVGRIIFYFFDIKKQYVNVVLFVCYIFLIFVLLVFDIIMQYTSTNFSLVPDSPSQLFSTNIFFDQQGICDIDSEGKLETIKSDEEFQSKKYLIKENDIIKGFRVQLSKLSCDKHFVSNNSIEWGTFGRIQHYVDSSSCHIYTAYSKEVPVVLKIIKPELSRTALSLSEFETEVNILSRVRHPHIIRFLGSGKVPRPFLVLELLGGGSLAHRLGLKKDRDVIARRHVFSYREALQFAVAIASALDYLHNGWSSNASVIHRDLKPDNIGYTADGTVKLFDFGLCVCVLSHESKSDLYKLTGNTGTLRYMAPEVAEGRPYNKSVDVFSFSVILWQVLKGKVPYAAMNAKRFFEKVVKGGTRPALDDRWPQQLKTLLGRGWSADYKSRPDIAEVLSTLEKLLRDCDGRGSSSDQHYWASCYRAAVEHPARAAAALLLLSLVAFSCCLRLRPPAGPALCAAAAAIAYFAALFLCGPQRPNGPSLLRASYRALASRLAAQPTHSGEVFSPVCSVEIV